MSDETNSIFLRLENLLSEKENMEKEYNILQREVKHSSVADTAKEIRVLKKVIKNLEVWSFYYLYIRQMKETSWIWVSSAYYEYFFLKRSRNLLVYQLQQPTICKTLLLSTYLALLINSSCHVHDPK